MGYLGGFHKGAQWHHGIKRGLSWEGTRGSHGSIMGRDKGISGDIMGDVMDYHGNIMGDVMDYHGKGQGKSQGISWEGTRDSWVCYGQYPPNKTYAQA